MIYKKATKDDILTIAQLRQQLLIDEGQTPTTDISQEIINFFEHHIERNTTILAIDNEEIIAMGSLLINWNPPSFTNLNGRYGYIHTFYTKKEYRSRGIATRILNMLLDNAKENGITNFMLRASKQGELAYKKVGFKADINSTTMFLELAIVKNLATQI